MNACEFRFKARNLWWIFFEECNCQTDLNQLLAFLPELCITLFMNENSCKISDKIGDEQEEKKRIVKEQIKLEATKLQCHKIPFTAKDIRWKFDEEKYYHHSNSLIIIKVLKDELGMSFK